MPLFERPQLERIELAKGQTQSWPGRAHFELTVLQGRVWLTHSGCADDFFVKAGQSLQLQGLHIVLEAETESVLHLQDLNSRQRPTTGPWAAGQFQPPADMAPGCT